MRTIKSIMKYIFIIYLFDVLDINIFLQIWYYVDLCQNKMSYI